jgi:hypothetical protein
VSYCHASMYQDFDASDLERETCYVKWSLCSIMGVNERIMVSN